MSSGGQLCCSLKACYVFNMKYADRTPYLRVQMLLKSESEEEKERKVLISLCEKGSIPLALRV